MQSSTRRKESPTGPRRKGRHDRRDESLEEAPQLLDDEPADIEQADPLEVENDSVEQIEDAEDSASSIFDEGSPSHDEPHE
jgi:hypothetical protein